MGKRVTIRDIAREAGYHFTTVSMALRKHPSIPEVTRKKIRAVANRLGYRPDPVLSALMSYRLEKRPTHYLATIAWLTNYPTRDGWKFVPLFEEHHRGAVEESERLGYQLETFWLNEPGMTPRRMSQILRSRGIQGVLLSPQPAAGQSIDLKWEDFSAVTFGYTLARPVLHGVSNNHFRTMGLLLEELFAREYRRCGYVEERRVDARVHYSWLGAFQVAHEIFKVPRKIPPFFFDEWSERAFEKWFNRHRPDVIVSKFDGIESFLAKRGLSVPGDIALVSPSLSDFETRSSGMKENSVTIGRSAVTFLASLLHRHEQGIPATPQRIMIEGVWNEGETVRPRLPTTATD